MTNLLICTFTPLHIIAFSNKRINMPTPRTVTGTLNWLRIGTFHFKIFSANDAQYFSDLWNATFYLVPH